MALPALEDEDLIDVELPPMDADEEDTERESGEDDLELDALDDGDGDPLDDAEASDLDGGAEGAELDELDDDPRDGDADEQIDVGPLDDDLIGAEAEPASAELEADGITGDDDEVDELDDGDDDSGDEGTHEPVEDEVDEDALPAIDADDDGDFEDASLVGEAWDDELADAPLPGWGDTRWEAREGAGAELPCRAVAARDGRVVAAGEAVLVVDQGACVARRVGPEGGAQALTLGEDGAALIATRRGQLIGLSPTGQATPLSAWRARFGGLALASTPGRAWALERGADGALWSLGGSPALVTMAREQGVMAIAASGASLFALTNDAAGLHLQRLRSDDEGWQPTHLAGAARAIAAGSEVHLAAAAQGRALAIAEPTRGLAVSRDGGASFQALGVVGVVAVAFAGDDEAAPALALVASSLGDGVCLVEVLPDGTALRVAELPARRSNSSTPHEDDAPERAFGMAWDATRELVWIAHPGGLVALGRLRTH
jgi:hypothetical protein